MLARHGSRRVARPRALRPRRTRRRRRRCFRGTFGVFSGLIAYRGAVVATGPASGRRRDADGALRGRAIRAPRSRKIRSPSTASASPRRRSTERSSLSTWFRRRCAAARWASGWPAMSSTWNMRCASSDRMGGHFVYGHVDARAARACADARRAGRAACGSRRRPRLAPMIAREGFRRDRRRERHRCSVGRRMVRSRADSRDARAHDAGRARCRAAA